MGSLGSARARWEFTTLRTSFFTPHCQRNGPMWQACFCTRSGGLWAPGGPRDGSGSGFFVIHMPHPWGYTTGSWMPWAWGLTWSLLTSPRPNVAVRLFLLSLVLVLQVLPGHFQIAFLTQVGIMLMVVWYVLEPWICREWVEDSTTGIVLSRRTGQALAI